MDITHSCVLYIQPKSKSMIELRFKLEGEEGIEQGAIKPEDFSLRVQLKCFGRTPLALSSTKSLICHISSLATVTQSL